MVREAECQVARPTSTSALRNNCCFFSSLRPCWHFKRQRRCVEMFVLAPCMLLLQAPGGCRQHPTPRAPLPRRSPLMFCHAKLQSNPGQSFPEEQPPVEMAALVVTSDAVAAKSNSMPAIEAKMSLPSSLPAGQAPPAPAVPPVAISQPGCGGYGLHWDVIQWLVEWHLGMHPGTLAGVTDDLLSKTALGGIGRSQDPAAGSKEAAWREAAALVLELNCSKASWMYVCGASVAVVLGTTDLRNSSRLHAYPCCGHCASMLEVDNSCLVVISATFPPRQGTHMGSRHAGCNGGWGRPV